MLYGFCAGNGFTLLGSPPPIFRDESAPRVLAYVFALFTQTHTKLQYRVKKKWQKRCGELPLGWMDPECVAFAPYSGWGF